MGRAKTVMEDDEPTEHACKMPSFIGSFEAEGRVKLSGNLPAETSIANGEAEVRDAERCVAATKSRLSSDEEEEGGGEAEESRGGEEEKDAEGNNNNNCNGGGGGGGGEERRRASALEILRRNFGVSRPSSARLSSSGRMQLDPERESDENSDVAARHGSEKSEGETGDAATQNEPTASEPTGSDVHGVAARCRCEGDGHATGTDAHVNGKDHVYCTVYCIANDSRRTDAELPQGDHDAAERGEAPPSPPPGGEQPDARPDTDPSPEPTPYTLDDLVDPFADMAHWPYTEQQQQGGANTATQLCWVCLDEKTIAPLPCCKKAVCDECLKLYVSSQVRGAKLYIGCPIPECSGTLDDVMVTSHLASEDLAKYRYFLELSQLDSSTKPCPQCSEFTSLKKHNGTRSEHKYKIQCSNCHFLWCFKCHAPWHNGLKCREYRKGDKLLRSWASVIEHGQRNAQKCPQCKIHIQRTEGCDHMTCMQCSTNFCYRCGERYRHLRFFGDHTSNLSVFGCKYRYLPDKPNLRRLIRGSVCGVKVLIAPVVILLVVVVGALAVVIGLVVFPVYYVCKRRKKQRALGSGRWI